MIRVILRKMRPQLWILIFPCFRLRVRWSWTIGSTASTRPAPPLLPGTGGRPGPCTSSRSVSSESSSWSLETTQATSTRESRVMNRMKLVNLYLVSSEFVRMIFLYCTDNVQCMSDNIISSCHQRPIADQRWHRVTNKAFMLGPRQLLAASGPGNLLFVNRFIVRHDLEMMRYFIPRILIFLWMYIYFSPPTKMGFLFNF